MLNRPQNAFSEPASADNAARVWDVDERPEFRLLCLMILMTLPLCIIGVRLAWMQCGLTDDYIDAFHLETVVVESIPKRDGRILSADGRVLADDLQQFDIHVEYRWAEAPANGGWLKQQAIRKLERGERRDRKRLEEEMQQVLGRREAMWNRLAALTGTDPLELQRVREAIQRRVERISSSVDWKRREQNWIERRSESEAVSPEREDWWQVAWMTAVKELTTPPHRETNEPLVIQEELQHHRILENVPLHVAAEIQAHPELYPGLRIETSAIRIYPQKSLAPHIIGSRTLINEDELADRRSRFPEGDPLDYAAGDRIGRAGVERSFDRRLRGTRGEKRIVRDRRGEVIRAEVVREAVVGQDVVLTLHLELQTRLEAMLDRALAEKQAGATDEPSSERPASGGSIVAIDVHTGAVLAAASAPRFDLDLLVHPNAAEWKRLMDDPRRPFFDRSSQMALPPGSVFKALTAIAFLESGKIDPDERVSCVGYLDSPNRYRCYVYSHFGVGHGETDLADALMQSCNVYFFANARKIGPDPLVLWAERFGFGQPTGLDLPGEQPGELPRPSATRNSSGGAANRADRWQPGDTLGLSIGQSRLLATPMQVARMMAAIANGGKLVTPHVARPELTGSPASAGENSPAVWAPPGDPQEIPGLQPGTLERVREGLEKVVADRRGTGYKAVRMKEIAIAGKTGTAEVGGGKPDHAWFAGYVPADRPKIAFVVVLEHGGSGGRAAGPLAREFVQSLLELGIVRGSTITKNAGGPAVETSDGAE